MENQEICSTPLEIKNWDVVIGIKKGGHFNILKNRDSDVLGALEYKEMFNMLQKYRSPALILEVSKPHSASEDVEYLEIEQDQVILLELMKFTAPQAFIPIKASHWRKEYDWCRIKHPHIEKMIVVRSSKWVGGDENSPS